MAEVKNSFLQSKMNKDLDDRLIPNGQYREALNISVGKSESNNVGVLQNILGNAKLNVLSTVDASLTCVGAFMDNQNNRIYQFLTNYTDLAPENITLCDNITPPTGGWVMKITVYDFNTNPQYKTLVSGTFLNFSTTNLIIGVNLVEGLLFWTDNRNQPRKINVESAINNPLYYTTETQISVAKYAPIDPISMFRKATVTITDITGNVYSFEDMVGTLEVGMTLISGTMPESGYSTVITVGEGTFELYFFNSGIIVGDTITFLTSTMTNKSDDPGWAGDPSFLEDKYVRFSYRFKFDDNEYSLIAPFTQIAYIPKQKGYFVDGNESSAYKSTVISWMENNVNNIELLVPLPDTGNNIRDSYKIEQLEILYKESDALSIKVLDTIEYIDIRQSSPNNNIYNYVYQSQKPFKTLPEDQITRVYDNVPVRALSQEIVGNRVVYGNFYNTYSPPIGLNYNTTVLPKSGIFNNFIEYPNHTVKQNRNYQIGFILADKFGRQSSVVLSTAPTQSAEIGGTLFGGSTIYAPYEDQDSTNIVSVKNWFGNAIVAIVNSTIDSVRDIQAGTPGLYAEPVSNIGFIVLPGSTTITDNSYQFTIDSTPNQTVPTIGDSMRGAYTDYVTVIPKKPGDPNPSPPTYFVRTSGRVNDLYLSNSENPVDKKFSYNINEIGWYSYRIVVKQQEQEYYNVYLPGMLDGYPSDQTYGSQVIYDSLGVASTQNGINITDFPVGEIGKTSHIVLINDNINKVPRDLVEVGPDQKLYRSSVSLYGKVENSITIIDVLADEDYLVTNPLATSIIYKLLDNGDATGVIKTVVPGNGIQSNEANDPIDNPNRWYANTAVISNELYSFLEYNLALESSGDDIIGLSPSTNIVIIGDEVVYEIDGVVYYATVTDVSGSDIEITPALTVDMPANTELKIIRPTHGIITFSPPNNVINDGSIQYLNYTIAKGENIQYFPTRKADIVTAIATAADFNFLENDVNNIKGTAGLNFYQLQTRPSIGRVSVVNPIGVVSDKMTPYLSVYETKPVSSALQLFWETTSTGLISDLNYDVLVGYEGPIGFSNINFLFYENQNKLGTDTVEGEPDSKWITNTFVILNNTGVPLPFIGSPILVSVFDNSSPAIDLTSKFGVSLNEDLDPSTIRLFIDDAFVFDHNAPTLSSYTFTIKVEWETNNFATFELNGRLRNNEPYFTETVAEYSKKIFINTALSPSQPIVTLTASNGSFATSPQDQQGLYWTLIEGNENNYFTLNSTNGLLSLVNQTIPLGVYTLKARIQDAYAGGPLVGDEDYYGTLFSDIEFTVTIVTPPVPESLIYETDEFVWNHDTACSSSNVIGQGYAAFYIGASNLELGTFGINNGINPFLPDITETTPAPPATSAFQSYINVGEANGLVFGSSNPPTGLTTGSIEFIVSNIGRNLYPNTTAIDTLQKITAYCNTQRQGKLEYILYYRPLSSPINGSWSVFKNNNSMPLDTPTNTPAIWDDFSSEMSVYHYTALRVASAATIPASPLNLTIIDNEPLPKVNDYIVFGLSLSGNGYYKITEVYPGDGIYTVILETGGPSVSIPANSIVNVARIPENSPGDVLKQTSLVATIPGEYCLVLRYKYKREVLGTGFTRTADSPSINMIVTLDPSTTSKEVFVGDTISWREAFSPFTAYIRTITQVSGVGSNTIRISGSTVGINDGQIFSISRSYPENLYCSTIDLFGKVQTKDVNDYENSFKYDVAINTPSSYPYSRELGSPVPARLGFDYLVNVYTNAQLAVSNEITIIDFPGATYLNDMVGSIAPGVYIWTSGYTNWVGDPYFNNNTRVVSINEATKELILSSNTKIPIPENTEIVLFTRNTDTKGNLWATTDNGNSVEQFYIDEDTLIPWQPAFGGRYCTYRNSDRNYSSVITDGPITWSAPPINGSSYITLMPPITEKPYFTAMFENNGSFIANSNAPFVNYYTAWDYNQRGQLFGSATAVNGQYLIDTNNTFLQAWVKPLDWAYNITRGLSSTVVSVVDSNTILLADQIISEIGDNYIISPYLDLDAFNLLQVKSI